MTKLRAPPTLSPEIPYASILLMTLIVAAFAILVTHSGTIEALNASGLLR
jgi:hypothetical protein